MRRLTATLLALTALAVGGCNGDSSSALDVALSHLPRDAAFAVALETDTDGDQYRALGSLLGRFPFGDQARGQLREQLEQTTNGRFEEDVRPLLGNPLVVGGAAAGGEETRPIAALQVEDEGKLGELVERRGTREVGEAAGATIYQRQATFIAVEDDVVVFAQDRRELTDALERADGDEHLDEEAFDDALEGLPEDALARLYVDLQAVLENDPDTANARELEWVGALRTLGATATPRRDAVDIDFRMRTEGELSDDDLPIAPGDEAPGVIRRDGEVGLGIRDLAHIIRFAERAGQTIDPAGFGDYARAKRTIDSQLDVSLDEDLIGQLTGDVSASIALDGGFGVRSELEDPPAFERTLEKVADVLPNFAEGAGFGRVELTKPRAGEDFYELRQAGGGSVFFGVVDDVLVVASDRGRAEQLATAEPSAVSGARGSVALGADAEQLANALLAEFGAAFGVPDLGGFGARLITGPLGELSGHASSSTDDLRGRLTLRVD